MEPLRAVCVGCGLGAQTIMAGLRARTDDITGLIDQWSVPRALWNKQDTLRHDSQRVATALMALLDDGRRALRALS